MEPHGYHAGTPGGATIPHPETMSLHGQARGLRGAWMKIAPGKPRAIVRDS